MSLEAAYHEAGHAVLARKSTYHEVVGEVSLGSYKSGVTAVSLSKRKLLRAGKPADSSACRDPDVAREIAAILCGGLVAEQIAKEKGRKLSPTLDPAASDHQFARDQLAGAGLDTELTPHQAQAGALLREHWDHVERLAVALLSTGSRDAVDVHDLVPG